MQGDPVTTRTAIAVIPSDNAQYDSDVQRLCAAEALIHTCSSYIRQQNQTWGSAVRGKTLGDTWTNIVKSRTWRAVDTGLLKVVIGHELDQVRYVLPAADYVAWLERFGWDLQREEAFRSAYRDYSTLQERAREDRARGRRR